MKDIKVGWLIFFFLLMLIFESCVTQQHAGTQKERRFGRYQKWWVITHPFVARRAYKLTKKVLVTSAEMKSDADLDGDPNGGQVDAFRHSYWMALLSQHIRKKKVLKLGKAHEKDDYLFYKKDLVEDGSPGDSLASVMDSFNNATGAELGDTHKQISEVELKQLIKQEILSGNMKVLLKDNKGRYLDCTGNLIRMEDWKGSWYKPKCLQPSNYRNKKTQ